MEMKKNSSLGEQLKIVFPRGVIIEDTLNPEDPEIPDIEDDTWFLFPTESEGKEPGEEWLLGSLTSSPEEPMGKIYRITPKGTAHLRQKRAELKRRRSGVSGGALNMAECLHEMAEDPYAKRERPLVLDEAVRHFVVLLGATATKELFVSRKYKVSPEGAAYYQVKK